jgi:pullulanase
VEQYHIDGFRFDLMGLLDTAMMDRLQKRLDEKYGPGEKLVYGEPWRAADTAAKGVTLCDKDALKQMNSNIGAFCDDTRDAVKGSVMNESSVGFVNGGVITADALRNCVAGWAGDYGPFQTPAQTINYLSCHDDWTLWDKLVYTLDPCKDFEGCGEEIKRVNRLAAAIYFSCQGRIFLHAGEEFGRTKGGIKNSYCSSPEINQLDWKRAWENADLVDYYRGLIALRKQLPGLQDKSENASRRILQIFDIASNCAGVLLNNRGESTRWETLLLCFNCSKETAELSLPEGNWQILVTGENAFCWEESLYLKQKTKIPPQSALLLGR